MAGNFRGDEPERGPLSVLEHLVAVQGQEPNWPYVGLWTRITGFKQDELTALLESSAVVRSTVIRVTQHLVAAADIGWPIRWRYCTPWSPPRRRRCGAAGGPG